MKASMSAGSVFQGKDTRMASLARVPKPMACSTWLGEILPELQAAPAETAKPIWSSMMTCRSARTPANARQTVFGKRVAPAPQTSAPNCVAATATRSRKPVSLTA